MIFHEICSKCLYFTCKRTVYTKHRMEITREDKEYSTLVNLKMCAINITLTKKVGKEIGKKSDFFILLFE